MRTLSEILIQADNATSIVVLKLLADEIIKQKDEMLLHEVIFGLEHIKDIGLAMKRHNEINQLMS